MYGDPVGHASTSWIPDPASRTEANTEATPDYPHTEDSDRISATNFEVESAMNYRRRRAALRDPGFLEEAFSAFNSGDAYIRAARDGLARATNQYLKDIRVLLEKNNLLSQELEKCQTQLRAKTAELEESKKASTDSADNPGANPEILREDEQRAQRQLDAGERILTQAR